MNKKLEKLFFNTLFQSPIDYHKIRKHSINSETQYFCILLLDLDVTYLNNTMLFHIVSGKDIVYARISSL